MARFWIGISSNENSSSMKGVFSLVSALLAVFIVSAQPEGLSWQQTLGASETEYFGGIAVRQDGGYFVCGYSNSVDGPFTGNQGNWDMFLAALSPTGDIENVVTVGSSGFDQCNDLVALENGGVAIIGRAGESDGDVTTGNNGSSDVWIGVFNADLELTAQYGFGGNSLDEGEAIIQTSDGGYLLTGRTSSMNGAFGDAFGADDAFLIKLAPDFALVWIGRYGGSDWDVPNNLIETEGGYIVVGGSQSSDNDLETNQGEDDAWVFKVDMEGNVLWSTSFGGSFYDSISSIAPDIDGNFVLVGTSKYEDDEVLGVNSRFGLIARMTPEGEIISQLAVGTQSDDGLADVIVKADGTIVCLGVTSGSFSLGGIGGSDYYLVEVDPSDNVTWEQVYGGSMGDGGFQMIGDGEGYVLAGQHVGNDGNITQAYGSFDVSVLRVGDVSQIQGCTDPQACNYLAEATLDDGSCEYLEVYVVTGASESETSITENYSYTETAGSSYTWTVTGGEIISGQGTAEVAVQWLVSDAAGELCVVETSADGCLGEAVCIEVYVTLVGVNNTLDYSVTVYPNPATESCTLVSGQAWRGGVYVLRDLQGRILQEGAINQANLLLPLNEFAQGHYFIRLLQGAEVKTIPLLVRK